MARFGAAVGRAGPTFGHESIELFAIFGAANRVYIFGEFTLSLIELTTLFVEPGMTVERVPQGSLVIRTGAA